MEGTGCAGARGVQQWVAGNSKRLCGADVVDDRCQLGLGSGGRRPWMLRSRVTTTWKP